jgi:hypothetical protein
MVAMRYLPVPNLERSFNARSRKFGGTRRRSALVDGDHCSAPVAAGVV